MLAPERLPNAGSHTNPKPVLVGGWIMNNSKIQELLERDIGKMVIRIDTLIAQLDEVLEENATLKARLVQLTTEVHANGS